MKQSQIQSLLSLVKNQSSPRPANQRFNSKTLIIDGMNTFIRAFAMDNKFNRYGHHVGGISSFLMSIGSAIKNECPSRVIIVFDGEGGYINRRYLYPDYKKNRENLTGCINKKVFDDKKDEDRAKMNEIERLVEYLEFLPVTLASIDKMEADDVMAYMAQYLYKNHPENQVCIMSSDRDFFQLVNDRVYVYSPTKKKHYFVNEVTTEFNCSPENYLIYKCFLGDTSDNIKGVHGVGEKKIQTLFPDMLVSGSITFDDIYAVCEDPPGKSVLYDRILNSKHILDINAKIMDLSDPFMNEDQEEYLVRELVTHPKDLRKSDFLQLWSIDKMNNAINNVSEWINLFSVLNQ